METPPMGAQLVSLLRELAQARRDADASAGVVTQARDAFEAGYVLEITKAKTDAACVAALDVAVRSLARAVFDATENPTPAPGVIVKQFKTTQYDVAAAFAWAQQAHIALIPEQLDRKSFEKIAAATTLPFVTYGTEPRITIATDLDKALSVADAIAPVAAPEASV